MDFSIRRTCSVSEITVRCSFLVLFGLTLNGCSVTQPVRCLPVGETQAMLSAGGPFARTNNVLLPIPYVNAGIVNGYSDNLTLSADIHATMALLKDAAFDFGATTRLVHEDGSIPEVTLKGQMYVFSDLEFIKNARLFPLVTINASRSIGNSSLLYLGADQLLQFNKPNYFLSPFAGVQFPLTNRLSMQTELKWMAANKYAAHGTLRGVSSVGGYGGLAFFAGFSWRTSQ